MSRIYVAGPLSHPDPARRLANVEAAIDAAIALYQAGHAPYVPHLTHFVDVRQLEQNAGLDYETWLRTDLDWLQLCHGVLALGHSPGADRELAYAESHGIPVYWDVDDVPAQAGARCPAPLRPVGAVQ